MPILALDKSTVKLITSTQVITSVSSVVKELVENSLDADAKNIEINLSDNGLSVIEIRDDGCGVLATDVPNMALPHSTSKISEFGDLDSLNTYGFRGEALNAICKVSAEVSVTTKTNKDDTAKIYTFDSNGCIVNVELSPRFDGTTVRVKKLFNNIPVRRQMISDQKKSKQDIKYIDNLLKSLSVSNPPVRISFRVNNSLVFLKPSCVNVREALRHFLGSKVCANLEWIEYKDSEIQIQLMIPKKNITEYHLVYEAGEQFVIVNKRPVKYKQFEKIINERINDHFGDKVPTKKRAVYFLSLSVSSDEIDVNLEPNKTSVILKNQDSISNKLDKLLLEYYNISDENSNPANTGINISIDDVTSEYHDISHIVKSVEIETPTAPPACKKLKLNNCKEKVRDFMIDSNADSDSKRKSTERSKKDGQNLYEKIEKERIFSISNRDSVDRILESFPGPDLSDSDGESKVTKETRNTFVKVGHAARPAISSEGENRGHDFGQEKNLESSESFAFSPNDAINGTVFEGMDENRVENDVETLSQLPVVDLGEDFDIVAILEKPRVERTVKEEIISEQEINCENDDRIKDIENKEKPKVTLELWSKGQIPGLKGSTDVSVLNDPKSIATDKKHIETSSQTLYHTGFSKFSHEIRSQVMEENPGAALPTIGKIFASRWKELSPEERGFYRDLALDEKRKAETEKKKLKNDKITQQESDRNKARLVKMLESMKKTKITTKKCPFNERTTVPWQITVQTVTENFFTKKTSEPLKIIGRLTDDIWALKSDENICVISNNEVSKAKGQLKDHEEDKNIFTEKENTEKILSSLLREKKLSDVFFHPIYRIDSNLFQQLDK